MVYMMKRAIGDAPVNGLVRTTVAATTTGHGAAENSILSVMKLIIVDPREIVAWNQ